MGLHLLVLSIIASFVTAAVPQVYLPSNPDGAGIGFLFSSSTSESAALSLRPPNCAYGLLDTGSPYFFLYGCALPATFALQLAVNNSGYQYSSDKSITLQLGEGPKDLLLANLWPLTVHFQTMRTCHLYQERTRATRDCFASSCTLAASFSVSCAGGAACEGCVLKSFWEWSFINATFLISS